jgi:hypothetical protein
MEAMTQTPRSILHQVIADVAREHCLEPAMIETPSRFHRIIAARAAVAQRLHQRGQPDHRIAHMMRVNLSVVRKYLRRVVHNEEEATS